MSDIMGSMLCSTDNLVLHLWNAWKMTKTLDSKFVIPILWILITIRGVFHNLLWNFLLCFRFQQKSEPSSPDKVFNQITVRVSEFNVSCLSINQPWTMSSR